MGRHLRQDRSRPTLRPALLTGTVAVVGAAALAAGVALTARAPGNVAQSCPAAVRVVTATSFAPVLTGVAPALAQGPDCVRLDVTVADGRTAVERVAEPGVDAWIPDDAGWASNPGTVRLAEAPAGGAGTVVAESPFYLVTDEGTAQRVTGAGGGWLGLTGLVTGDDPAPVRLAVRDPGGSGDGMLGLGAFAESVWVKDGMDASAEVLAGALPRTRTVVGDAPALPEEPGEVGLVSEHDLLPVRERLAGAVVLAPRDHTAVLRYSWLPTAAAAADPARARTLDRVRAALTGPAADEPLAQAGLRRPGGGPPPGADGLPAVEAPPFEVLGPHHVDHVLATWYAQDRRSDLLVAVDVSGSMVARAPGSGRAVIDVVRDGIGELASLLPDDSQLALWRFGSRLDGDRDHEAVLRATALDGEGRAALSRATAELRPRDTGTGLHDTILAAYEAARDSARPGVPSHVVVFTDGRNEADEPTLSLDGLRQRLAAAKDPQRPVELTVIAFGDQPEAEALKETLKPVDAYLTTLRTADQVNAAFIHAAAHGIDA